MDRTTRITLAGVAALALAGVAYAAAANTRRLDVALPEGGVAHIEYTGDVAPKVIVSRGIAADPVGWPAFAAAPFAMPEFAALDRIAADMDRQARAVMAQAGAVAGQPFGQLDQVSLARLPAGTVQYSYVSTSTGKGVCNQSVQVTSTGTGQPPKVVRQVSGNCDVAKDAARQPTLAATRPAAPRANPGPARTTI